MVVFEELFPVLSFGRLKGKTMIFSESMLRTISQSMATTSCGGTDLETCRDESGALTLKFVAIAAILVAGVSGVAIPLVGKKRRFLRTDGNLFFAAKAFAAGVILATGFVHMLPDGSTALSDSCLPKNPWSKFPFSGFFAMVSALATLVVDFVGTQYYERKQERTQATKDPNGKVHGHGHSHGFGLEDGDEEDGGIRHVVVSQVLELGIISHSVIIGLSLGVSQSPCTIRPLIAALSFHQFFEGFALGGCISQAQFKTLSTTLMACFFAITTPAGIAFGTAISSSYNPDSPRALVIEGIFDCVSAGILIYMALVDLIAADFLSKRMKCNVRLQVLSYLMLFLGAGMMSALAIWA
ncbi:unnamed protein product, partial [Vitis vinifera]